MEFDDGDSAGSDTSQHRIRVRKPKGPKAARHTDDCPFLRKRVQDTVAFNEAHDATTAAAAAAAALVPKPKGPPRAQPPKPKYTWAPNTATIGIFAKDLAQKGPAREGWPKQAIADNTLWERQLARFGTVHFTQNDLGYRRPAAGAAGTSSSSDWELLEPTPEQVTHMLPLALAALDKQRLSRMVSAAEAQDFKEKRAKEKRKRDESRDSQLVEWRALVLQAKTDQCRFCYRDEKGADVPAVKHQSLLAGSGVVSIEQTGPKATVYVTITSLYNRLHSKEHQEPQLRQPPNTYPGTAAQWTRCYHREKPGGEEPTEWGKRAHAEWVNNEPRRNPQQEDDPGGTAELPFQEGYTPLRLKGLLTAKGDMLVGDELRASPRRHGEAVVPHVTRHFTPIAGRTPKERLPCGLVRATTDPGSSPPPQSPLPPHALLPSPPVPRPRRCTAPCTS